MICGKKLQAIVRPLVLFSLLCCFSVFAYSQDEGEEKTPLLTELEQILERQQKRIEMLEVSLEERKQRIKKLESLLEKSENSLDEMEKLLQKQNVILEEQEPLFKSYEKMTNARSIEAGLLGGFGGALLGFVSGVISTYYITR